MTVLQGTVLEAIESSAGVGRYRVGSGLRFRVLHGIEAFIVNPDPKL